MQPALDAIPRITGSGIIHSTPLGLFLKTLHVLPDYVGVIASFLIPVLGSLNRTKSKNNSRTTAIADQRTIRSSGSNN